MHTKTDIQSRRILIVDDSATMRLYLRRLLTAWGYLVEEATTGYEGIERAMLSPFDLILADINMPTMNGYAMVTALRKEITVQAVPIIMSSTEASETDVAQAYAVGANLYMVKPVQPKLLQYCVKYTIGQPQEN